MHYAQERSTLVSMTTDRVDQDAAIEQSVAEECAGAESIRRAERFLTIQEYASLVRLSENHVYILIRTNKLKYGRVVRVTDRTIRIAVPVAA